MEFVIAGLWRWCGYGLVLLAAVVGCLALPHAALAHDDPVLTVRVLCAGLTDGQVEAALGEVDDNATVLVDRPLVGRAQIRAWMLEQLALNLRVEVVDVRPSAVADGYAVTWTTRMFREDWRKAGVAMRQTTEQATIHNGRITRWTSSLASERAPERTVPPSASSAAPPATGTGPLVGGVPLAEIPPTLLGLVGLLVLAGGGLALRAVQRSRH